MFLFCRSVSAALAPLGTLGALACLSCRVFAAPYQPPAVPATSPTTSPTTPTQTPAQIIPAVTAPAALPTAIDVPPPALRTSYLPFASLPAVPLDEANNGVGIAQQMTRSRNLQARLLWIDATANLDKINSADKIAALVGKIKSVGFNTIVLDVKPIIGYTLYPSKYAPKITEWVRPWGTQTLPKNFDPLKEMSKEARLQNIGLIVNLNVFSEGHRDFQKGPGYDHPEWQTTLYEVQTRVRRDLLGTPAFPVMDRADQSARTPGDLVVYTDLANVPPGAQSVALLDTRGVVVAQVSGSALKTLAPTLPTDGAALVATTGEAANFLRLNAAPGFKMVLDTVPIYVPISQRPDRQVPLMTNPNSPVVRQRMLNILSEVVTNYVVDGVIFDDRLRYAGINADFSPATRLAFEKYANNGKPLRWPNDVFHYEVDFPTLERREVPGPYYDAWATFRALTLRNWLADAVRTVKTIRPQATVSTYVGSWYPDYLDVGANWGASDLGAGFRFLNDSYRKTGWAGLTDFVTTGCYYRTASILEAAQRGQPIGETVEAAGQFSNRAVNDQTFVYAGISLDQFKNNPVGLKRVLQAAAATTQGIMCFDLSHDIEPLWAVFAEAFERPAIAPHQISGLVDELRAAHRARKLSGAPDPPIILYRGTSGTGF